MRFFAAAKTDVGRKRQDNEDRFCLEPALGLYVVADGMGGHAAGEVASRLAVETIQEWMEKYLRGLDAATGATAAASGSLEAAFLASSIQQANRVIFEAAKARPEYAGMGTTIVATLAHGDRFIVAHVGDSRIYRIRGGVIAQLSRDHSFVQQQVDCGSLSPTEAQRSQYRHMITRALGLKESVDVDLGEHAARPDDIILLCSDGLSDLLDDEEILNAVEACGADLERACETMVDRANAKGGDDNITVLTVQARAEHGVAARRGSGRSSGRRGVFAWWRRARVRSDARS